MRAPFSHDLYQSTINKKFLFLVLFYILHISHFPRPSQAPATKPGPGAMYPSDPPLIGPERLH